MILAHYNARCHSETGTDPCSKKVRYGFCPCCFVRQKVLPRTKCHQISISYDRTAFVVQNHPQLSPAGFFCFRLGNSSKPDCTRLIRRFLGFALRAALEMTRGILSPCEATTYCHLDRAKRAERSADSNVDGLAPDPSTLLGMTRGR